MTRTLQYPHMPLPPQAAGIDTVAQLTQQLASQGGECTRCDHFEVSRGFFKYPVTDYSCHGVKSVFRGLAEAARELRADLAAATDGADESA